MIRLAYKSLCIGFLLFVAFGLIYMMVMSEFQDFENPREASPPRTIRHLVASDTIEDVIERGTKYLLKQHANDDQLWHSTYYGNLKDGAAITAFVLYSLPEETGENSDNKLLMQQAVDKLLIHVRENGYVSNKDGPDYSNYGSSMLLLACRKHNLKIPDADVDTLLNYLVRSQLDEAEGFDRENVDYGGWDLSGWMTGNRPTTGSNISVSCSVVQALVAYRDRKSLAESIKDCLTKNQLWLSRVHNTNDGGFYFHPKRDHDGNKAGWEDGDDRKLTRSYGSATADGLQMQILHDLEEDEIEKTIQWLTKKEDLAVVPGFEHESGEASWSVGLRYYYYQSLSRSLSQFEPKSAKRIARSIATHLLAEQRADGSWSNPNARMREDDPMIATGFALQALMECQKHVFK